MLGTGAPLTAVAGLEAVIVSDFAVIAARVVIGEASV